jgi:DNA-directed RNA polymerase subunit RPC12/RpoP
MADEKTGGGERISAEDTVECPRCGTYVVPKGAVSCGRADCPYPN